MSYLFAFHAFSLRLLRVALLLLGLVGGYGLFGTAVQAETLADALSSAYEESDILRQNRALLRAADEDVAIAVSALRPQINFNASATGDQRPQGTQNIDSLTTTINLTAALRVFDFGSSQLAIDAQKETVLATRQELLNVEQRILIGALRAYMNVIQSEQVVDLRINNVDLIEQQLLAAQDRFDVGEITRTEVSLAESRLARSKGDLAAAQGDLAVAREEYKAIIGNYPNGLQPPPRLPDIAPSLAAARVVALQKAPAIVKLQHESRASELNAERAIANSRGNVNLNATVERRRNNRNIGTIGNSQNLGLSLRIPLYTGGNNDALYRQAMARIEAVQANLQFANIDQSRIISNAWANLQVAIAQIKANQLRVEASRIALSGVNEEVRLGARTTLDALNAEQELLDAQTALVQAENNRYIRVYEALEAMGLMTVEHLGLDVETYDVTEYYEQVKTAPANNGVGFHLRALTDGMRKAGESLSTPADDTADQGAVDTDTNTVTETLSVTETAITSSVQQQPQPPAQTASAPPRTPRTRPQAAPPAAAPAEPDVVVVPGRPPLVFTPVPAAPVKKPKEPMRLIIIPDDPPPPVPSAPPVKKPKEPMRLIIIPDDA